jgi:hypothetical protein
LAALRLAHPAEAWPSASTVGDLLKRTGLIVSRRRESRTTNGPVDVARRCRRGDGQPAIRCR